MSQASRNATVKVDGQTYRTRAGTTRVMMGGHEREEVMADDGSVHFKETPVPGGVTTTLIHMGDTEVAALRNVRGSSTVTVEYDNGRVYTVGSAFVKNNLEINDGEVEVQLGGSVTIEQ